MESIDNLSKMMTGSLGLEELWYIIGAEFNEKELALHIPFGIQKGAGHCLPQMRRANQTIRL
ncbi:MAG: hypothetical protein LLG09_03425 [Negativicutes bacterium]|nr:hypothetical protein [Negativicutes bacterium]